MSVIEAQDLAMDIRDEVKAKVQVRQLGNGEWVITLNHVFIWDVDDWQRMKGQDGVKA